MAGRVKGLAGGGPIAYSSAEEKFKWVGVKKYLTDTAVKGGGQSTAKKLDTAAKAMITKAVKDAKACKPTETTKIAQAEVRIYAM